MSQNNNTLVGQVDLLSLAGASYLNVNGKDSIVIPTEDNPSIFISSGKNGSTKAYLDIVVRETTNNQFGNSHFVKATVGKTNRERLGLSKDDLSKYSPIIGNLRILEGAPRESQDGFKGF